MVVFPSAPHPHHSDMAPHGFGTLRYKIRYDHSLGKLHVTVVECQNLPKKDLIGSIDPYVKVFLMPGNHADLKTKSLKKDQNPSFNDEFSFVIDVANAQKKTIVYQVYDKDLVGKDDPVCEYQVPLWLVNMKEDVDKEVDLEKATLENKKPVLKLKRPPAASQRSSVSSMASSLGATTFAASGGYTSTIGGSGASTSYRESSTYQQSSSGQAFNAGQAGQGFHGSTVGQGFHASNGGQGYHSSHSTSTVIRRHSGSSDDGTPTRRPLSQDHALSLHLLNERLEKYIEKIKLNPESNRASIDIVEQQDAKGLNIESLAEYHEWLEICHQYELEEEDLAKLRTENEALSFENASIKSGNDRLEYEIQEFEAKIRKMREDIDLLKGRYKSEKEVLERQRMEKESSLEGAFHLTQELPKDWRESNVEIMVNNARASLYDDKRRFIDSVNSREWEEEKTSQSFDKTEIRNKIKEQYDRRLKEELEKLRAEYDDFFKYVNLSTKQIYENKMTELRKKMGEMTPDERREVDEILRKLKEAKERAFSESLEEDEAYWKAMLDEKKRELAWLQEQFHSLEFAYREFSKTGGVSKEEVKRYSELIQGVKVQRVNEHAKQFYEGDNLHVAESSSSSSSSSSEDEAFDKPHRSSKH